MSWHLPCRPGRRLSRIFLIICLDPAGRGQPKIMTGPNHFRLTHCCQLTRLSCSRIGTGDSHSVAVARTTLPAAAGVMIPGTSRLLPIARRVRSGITRSTGANARPLRSISGLPFPSTPSGAVTIMVDGFHRLLTNRPSAGVNSATTRGLGNGISLEVEQEDGSHHPIRARRAGGSDDLGGDVRRVLSSPLDALCRA